MLHILIGLAVATPLIIGWAYGGLFACVFLSIAPAFGLIILALQQLPGGSPSSPAWVLVCAILLAIIWTPRILRRLLKGPPPPHMPALWECDLTALERIGRWRDRP